MRKIVFVIALIMMLAPIKILSMDTDSSSNVSETDVQYSNKVSSGSVRNTGFLETVFSDNFDTGSLDGAKWTSGEQVGVEILKLALEEPVKQIAKNAGKDGVMIVEGVKTRDGNEGYDALTGKFVDMVKAGIVDPTKVTRTALQNAASVAATFLTTEAVVVDVPVEDYQIPLQPQLM